MGNPEAMASFTNVYITIFRWIIPVLVLFLLFRCIKPLVFFRREPEIWAWLCLPGDKKVPITHWESVIGRHAKSDIVIDFPTVSRTHAVLTRAGAALVIAGLSAEGTTCVKNIHYIERGYENLIEKLSALGADIKRIED